MSSKPEIKPAIAPNPAAPAEAPPPPPDDAMRRLQIGIAGVLTVLLLVGMAGLIGDRARERAAAERAAWAVPGVTHVEDNIVIAAWRNVLLGAIAGTGDRLLVFSSIQSARRTVRRVVRPLCRSA